MIDHVSHITVYVLDQDSALEFYTDKLGFQVRNDVSIEDARWLTVASPTRPDFELILADCAMGHDEQTAATLRDLVSQGALGAGVLATDDCRAAFEELTARGVTFLQEPAERPYGIEAILRDDSGNWFSLTQRAEVPA